MKKIISIVLMLTLCLGLFAGCEQPAQPTEPGVSDLANAKTYLFKMYNTAGKDEENKLLADKDVTSVVMIGGVSYPVTWTVEITSGPADGVKIVESDTPNHVKVDIMDQPEEELHYILTATVKDEAGNSESMSLKCFTPAVKKVEVTEDKIVLFNPDGGVYVTGTDYLYTSSSGSQKHELEVSTDKSAALQLTVKKNDDGTVTFVTNDGKYLMADGTHVQIVDAEGDNTKFVLEAAENGQFIKCANATYNDKAQYLEIYSGYLTCYGMNESKAAIYTFVMETVANQSAILDAAYSLGTGETLSGGPYTLTGVITNIDTAWDPGYKNITVTIVCDGDAERPIQCFRLQGEGAEGLAVGDTITVTGEIKNYNGTIEFDAKCNLDKVVKADGGEEKPDDKPEEPETPAVSIITDFTAPFAGGNKIVIVATNFNKAFSSLPVKEGSYYQKGADVTVADGTVTGHADTEVWTVIANDDGTFSFQQGDKNIGMQDSYSSMGLGHPNDKWELIGLSNGSFLLKNTVRGNYMQWADSFGNFSTYGSDTPNGDQTFYLSFFVVG